jgi:general secretion pathway protein D
MLSVKYTVDPGIEGKITIQTPKPVTRTAAIDLFQAALRSNNAALVNTDGTYRIVPIDQANIGAGIRVEGEPQGERIGSGLQVVSLKYVTAAEIRRVLEPIAPKGGIVRTDDAPRQFECTRLITVDQVKAVIRRIPDFGRGMRIPIDYKSKS